MQNLLNELVELLRSDSRLVADGRLLKNKVVELALAMDAGLIRLLLAADVMKRHFFTDVDGVMVFDKIKFMQFVSNKEFLPDSYTAFRNKIGLLDGKGDYIADGRDVVLAWPYKDCVLEGGQTKEDQKRDEVFWNETLAPDEIDRLLAPKVFTGWKKYDAAGEHAVDAGAVDFENENMIIRGNNLLALHSLYKRFAGKVKLIYIDPPYNTGGDSFGYNDRFNHSSWLTFVKNRLSAARKLLSNDGSILVQVDYHEIAYLKVIMDDLFGKGNFIQLISVKTASPAGFKTVNPGPIDVTEYILYYAKNRSDYRFKKMYVPVEYDANYDLYIENIDDEPTKWKLRSLRDIVCEMNGVKVEKTAQQTAKNAKKAWGEHWQIIRNQLMAKFALDYAERVVSIRDPHKPSGRLKLLLEESKQKRNHVFVYKKDEEQSGSSSNGYVINGGALSFYSNKIQDIDGQITPTELLTDLWQDISWDGIAKEGGVKLKNGKKPELLLKRIIEMTTAPNETVMDFFLGSGTACAVAHKMRRRYIGVEQLDYSGNDCICRLNNVISGDASGISKRVNWQGGGSFIYCELMEWNEAFVARIRDAENTGELLKIWRDMQDKAHLSYKLNVRAVNDNAAGFMALSMEEQKRFLLETLDLNQLYVNYSEMDDSDYAVDAVDKEINRAFYNED